MVMELFLKAAVIDVLWPYVVEYVLHPLAAEAKKRIGAFLFEYLQDLVPEELVDGAGDAFQASQCLLTM